MTDECGPRCDCGKWPAYACTCHQDECLGCGGKLDAEAKRCGREMCFECYCERQD
jgi:hypothetical protein